jgi:phosphoribosylamine--glycine ligase/phosphoribosylglycinamide formyltransferase/phosphoribosylformylglycinamidine cyclo-ligase
MSDNVLVIGSGGREHCLAWKLAQSKHVRKVYVAPGNGGSCQEYNTSTDKIENVASVNVADHSAVKLFCSEASVDLVIIGPEAPLAEGIVDYLSKNDIPCFGPTKDAARIETSKAFAKDFMIRHGIPTARYQSFTDCEKACQHIRTAGYPALVVKASGLAAGKGVIVAQNADEAEKAVVDILQVVS